MVSIRHRRGTAAQWTAANPTLAGGELGYETDTGNHKIGNGTDDWNDLPYFMDVLSSGPGSERGFVERLVYAQTAAVAPEPFEGMVLPIVGEGRRVDIEFEAPNTYHSVPGAKVSFQIAINGNLFANRATGGFVISPVNTEGRKFYVKRPIMIAKGEEITVQVYWWGEFEGTSTAIAADFAPIYLSATTR